MTTGSDSGPDQGLLALLCEQRRGVLATIKRDGRPQLSTVAYAHDAESGVIRVSVTDGRAKVHNLRRDPRAALHVTRPDMSAYVVVEADVELTPRAESPDDPTVEELVALYRSIVGEHPDWDDFRAAMVSEGRLVLRLHIGHAYGYAG